MLISTKIGRDTWKLQSERGRFVIYKNKKYIRSVSKNKVSKLRRMGLRALLYAAGVAPPFIDDILTFLGL